MSKHILLKGFLNEDRNIIEVGIDEAGRGALAGPVTVAACIMPHGFTHPLIKDSKLLNEKDRKTALDIVLNNAIAFHVEHVNVEDIENTNILRATMQGMVVMDYAKDYKKAAQEMGMWIAQGKLKSKEDVYNGIENFQETFARLFNGDKKGKLVLKVIED